MNTTNTRRVSLGLRADGARRSAATLSFLTLAPLFISACGFPRPPLLGNDTPGDAGGTDGSGNSAGSDASNAPGDTGGPAAPPDPGTTIHVSPNGDDANDGLVMPVKTLRHAIGLAAADPTLTGIVLAAGTYSVATGELFPYTVPANITIAGPAGGGALLAGNQAGPGITVARGTLQDIDLQGFVTAITATGTAQFKNIRVLTSSIAIQAETSANLTVDNLSITGSAGACSTGIVLNGLAQLKMNTVVTGNLGGVLSANDHSSANITSANITGDSNCTASILKFVSDRNFTLQDAVLQGGNVGIESGSLSPDVNLTMLTNVVIRSMKSAALNIGGTFQDNTALMMIGGELSGTSSGSMNCGRANMFMTDVTITQNTGLALFAFECSLTMRGCTVIGNGGGLSFEQLRTTDLGTSSSLGGNTFQNNKFAQVFVMDSDSLGPVVIEAVGNTWNPRAQMADDHGHYDSSLNPVRGPSQGDNYGLAASNLSIDL